MASPASGDEGSRRLWRRVRWVRRGVQVAALVLFFALLIVTQQRLDPGAYSTLFLRLDPLAALSSMVAAGAWLPQLAPALLIVALTVLLGRVWCGWICPLGTLLGWIRFPSARRLSERLPARLTGAKYVLLGAIGILALAGSLALLILDPITLLTRTATTSLLPAFDWAVAGLEALVSGWAPGSSVAAWMRDDLRGTLVPLSPPRYDQAVALLLLLLGIALLNIVADRFWCRFLCPLGALLSLLTKVQMVKPFVGDGCASCGACARSCRLGAIREVDERSSGTSGEAVPATRARPVAECRAEVSNPECTMCLDCLTACPSEHALRIERPRRLPAITRHDPSRREFVTVTALGVGALVGLGGALLFGGPPATAALRPKLIRPPGAQDEEEFLSRCVRCGECLLVCPTSGLQPALGQGGLEALWTPVLVPRLGHCEYSCTACGRVCPSEAIPKLDFEDKRAQVIGLAEINQARCLPWALGEPCTVCEEVCPVPHKAIQLSKPQLVERPDGTQDYLALPRVVNDRCIGCGICETKCPVSGTAAIVVKRRAASDGRGRKRQRQRSREL